MRLSLGLVLSLSAHALAFAAFYAGNAAEPPAADPPPAAAGETFELPAPETDVPLANASPSPAMVAAPAPAPEDDGPAHPQPPAKGRAAPRPSHAGRPSGGRADGHAEASAAGNGSSAQYGAVGERSAVDLATAFTRAFPQAASADPAWRSASFGAAGDADIVLTIDESGHLEHTQVLGGPSAALAGGIRRTLALIQGRTFVAHGKVTKLHVTGTVSVDSVHDGLHGEVFAIGGSFASGEGNAFFALAIGRRIDVRVRAR